MRGGQRPISVWRFRPANRDPDRACPASAGWLGLAGAFRYRGRRGLLSVGNFNRVAVFQMNEFDPWKEAPEDDPRNAGRCEDCGHFLDDCHCTSEEESE